jgi:hypothetical protein
MVVVLIARLLYMLVALPTLHKRRLSQLELNDVMMINDNAWAYKSLSHHHHVSKGDASYSSI